MQDDYEAPTEEELEVLKQYGIDDLSWDKYLMDTYKGGFDEEEAFNDYLYDSNQFNDIDQEIMESNGMYSYADLYDKTEKDLKDLGISEEAIEDVLITKKMVEDILSEYNAAETQYNLLHGFLHNGCDVLKDQKDFIYDLKSCVLQRSGFDAIEYHKTSSKKTLLAYYDIHGHGFHMPVDADSVEDDAKIKDITIKMIEKLRDPLPDSMPSISESLNILKDFLELDLDMSKEYASGHSTKPSNILGIKVDYINYVDEYEYEDHDEDYDDEYYY